MPPPIIERRELRGSVTVTKQQIDDYEAGHSHYCPDCWCVWHHVRAFFCEVIPELVVPGEISAKQCRPCWHRSQIDPSAGETNYIAQLPFD